MSSFTWLDYSENDQQRMLDVLSLFREETTRDELGLGGIRDALADRLFPGTSTIQTRARYFLFIPWIYRALEQRGVGSDRIAAYARRDEFKLIDALRRGGEASNGLIGARAGRQLKRLPSSVYWNGLRQWGILLTDGSRDAYHRRLSRRYADNNRLRALTEADGVREPLRRDWDPGLPPPPDDFLRETTFALSQEEGAYLRERLRLHQPATLLDYLATHAAPWEPTDFPWTQPDAAHLPPTLDAALTHARHFSELIQGAPLLYNLMLAEAAQADDQIADYETALAAWHDATAARQAAYAGWDRAAFWATVLAVNPRISVATRHFINRWFDWTATPAARGAIAANAPARDLIARRERQLKRGLARLSNPRALELWNGAAGTSRLTYRWAIAQRHLLDILEAADA